MSRAEFGAWLRTRRHELVAGPHAPAALALLGLDDAALSAWIAAPRQAISLPHASPNVFFPRVGVSWYVRHLQERDPGLAHLRVPLTHVNFSDLGWRPYAWWYVDTRGELRRATQFTRSKKRKHVIVASQGPLAALPRRARELDLAAARLARCGTDLAISYVLLTAVVERAAGLTTSGPTTYVPLPLLVEYARMRRADTPNLRWVSGLLAASPGRTIAPDGTLAPASDVPYVLDNPGNIALLAMLGEGEVIGGAKMTSYWPDVEKRVADAGERSGVVIPPPAPRRLPEVDYASAVAPAPELAVELAATGIAYSQGLAVAEHGAFAARYDPFS